MKVLHHHYHDRHEQPVSGSLFLLIYMLNNGGHRGGKGAGNQALEWAAD